MQEFGGNFGGGKRICKIRIKSCFVFLGLAIDTLTCRLKFLKKRLGNSHICCCTGCQMENTTVRSSDKCWKVFLSIAIPGSGVLNYCFYNVMINCNKPYHHIRINQSMKEDTVTCLLHFLKNSKKVVYPPDRQYTTTDNIQLFY